MIKQLHLVLLSVLMIAFGVSASAQDVVIFDFSTETSYQQFGLKGNSDQNGSDLGDITENVTATQGSTTLTVTPNDGTSNRMWQSNTFFNLRLYGGKMMIASDKNIAKIEFDNFKTGTITPNTGSVEETVWTAGESTNAVEFTFTKAGKNNTFINKITITFGEGGGSEPVDPIPGETKELYNITFDSETNVKTWTVEGSQKEQEDFLMFNDKAMQINGWNTKGMDETNYVVSPVVTLGSNNTVTFNHRGLYYYGDPAEKLCFLCVRTVGGEWTTLPELHFISNESSYYSAGEFNIPAEFNGKDVEFGLHILFDGATNCGYWYVQNFLVKGTAEAPKPETVANTFAEFKTLCVDGGADVTLNVKDAKVLFVNEYVDKNGNDKQEVYMKDATGALLFYNVGFKAAAGDVVNGTIKGAAEDYFGTAEFKANAETDAAALAFVAGSLDAGVAKGLDQISNDDISNMISVNGVKMISRDEENNKGKVYTNYYLVDANGNELRFYNKFHVAGFDAADFVGKEDLSFIGIIKLDFGKLQLCPIDPVKTGIENVENAELNINAPMYNVAGQKVNANYKGIVLQNGKKFINK